MAEREAEALGERMHQQHDDYSAYTSIMDTISEARTEVEAAAARGAAPDTDRMAYIDALEDAVRTLRIEAS